MTNVTVVVVTFASGDRPHPISTIEPAQQISSQEVRMNRKWIIATMVGSVAAAGLAIAPFVAQAQTDDQTPGGGFGRGPRMERMEPPIDLTEAQQAEMQQIRRETREQMANVLTEEQRQSFREGLEAGEPFPMVLRSLNLSDTQQEQLRTIMQTSMERRHNVLTDEQREQLREMGPHRDGGRRGGGMMRQGTGSGAL